MTDRPPDVLIAVSRVLAGDIDAFGEIVAAHEGAVLGVVCSLLENREATEDLVQQTFVRAYQHLDRFDPARGEFRHWLRGIARHVVQGELRCMAREHKRLAFYWEYLSGRDGEEEAERVSALERLVDSCREKMDGAAATVLRLRYDQGESMEMIARQLDRSLDTTRKLLSRARIFVRDCVERRQIEE